MLHSKLSTTQQPAFAHVLLSHSVTLLRLWLIEPVAALVPEVLTNTHSLHSHLVPRSNADRLQRRWSAGSGAGRSRHGGDARHAVRDMIPVRDHDDAVHSRLS